MESMKMKSTLRHRQHLHLSGQITNEKKVSKCNHSKNVHRAILFRWIYQITERFVYRTVSTWINRLFLECNAISKGYVLLVANIAHFLKARKLLINDQDEVSYYLSAALKTVSFFMYSKPYFVPLVLLLYLLWGIIPSHLGT